MDTHLGSAGLSQRWQFHFLSRDGFRLEPVTRQCFLSSTSLAGILGKAPPACGSRPRVAVMRGLLRGRGSAWGAGWGPQDTGGTWAAGDLVEPCLTQPRDGPASEFLLWDLLNTIIIYDPVSGAFGYLGMKVFYRLYLPHHHAVFQRLYASDGETSGSDGSTTLHQSIKNSKSAAGS